MKTSVWFSLVFLVLVSCSARVLDEVKYTSRPRTSDPSINTIKALSSVNSPADDFALTSTRLGKEIFFTSQRNGTQQLFRLENNQLENLPKILATRNQGIAAMPIQGDELIVAHCSNENNGCDLASFLLTPAGWSENPGVVSHLNSGYWDSQPFLTPEGDLLFFSSMRPGGQGGKDIYVSRRTDQGFTKPINLGSAINTPYDEECPFVTPDRQFLIFSSNGYPRLGGSDLFYAAIRGDKFDSPKPLPVPFNSEGNDLFYYQIPGSTKAYFASDRSGGKGGLDIYESDHLPVIDQKPWPEKNYLILTGQILDAKTRRPLDGSVKILDMETQAVKGRAIKSLQHSEFYYIFHNLPASFGMAGSARNYLFNTLEVKVPDPIISHLIQKDILLKDLSEAVDLKVFFDFNQAILKPASYFDLEAAYNFLSDYPDLRVEVSGHTDNVGTEDYNLALSQSRADAVKTYLVSKGISDQRIEAIGHGPRRPRVANDTEENRALNRRVEIRVLRHY